MEVIPELTNITFRKKWNLEIMMEHQNYLYHPIKNIDLQKAYRNFFEPNEYIFLMNENIKNRIKSGKEIKKVKDHLIQTVLMKSKDSLDKMKISEEWSVTEQKMLFSKNETKSFDLMKKDGISKIKREIYTDYCKILKEGENRVFYYRFEVPSIKEACGYMYVQGYEYESFYMTIEEEYQYENVSIKIVNIPSVLEFVKIHSYSKEECRRCMEYLGLKEEEKKSFQEIIKETNQKFKDDINPKKSLEFDQLKKSLSFVKMNVDEYKKLINHQLLKYEKIKSSMGSELKIYNEREVSVFM
jgi:hypothetical protein